jgi:hypothetical protein
MIIFKFGKDLKGSYCDIIKMLSRYLPVKALDLRITGASAEIRTDNL